MPLDAFVTRMVFLHYLTWSFGNWNCNILTPTARNLFQVSYCYQYIVLVACCMLYATQLSCVWRSYFPPLFLVLGGLYSGGSAQMVEKSLDIHGDEILYVGDHIFTDVSQSKVHLRWRTALICRELEDEVRWYTVSLLKLFSPACTILIKLHSSNKAILITWLDVECLCSCLVYLVFTTWLWLAWLHRGIMLPGLFYYFEVYSWLYVYVF